METLSLAFDDLRGTLARLSRLPAVPRLPLVAAALVTALLARPLVPSEWLAGWIGGTLLLVLLRARFPTSAALAALAGLVWGGAAVLLAGIETPLSAACLLPLLAASTWAAVTDVAPPRPFFTFVAGLCLPLPLAFAQLALPPLLPVAALFALAVGGLSAIVLNARAADAEASARETVLRHSLTNSEAELGRVRVELGTVQADKSRLEEQLAAAERELAVLRSKTSSLSSVVQRINPYDIETGLLNAERFGTVLDREWQRMQRQELPLSLLLVCIDGFDAFRDWHGRVAFEAALRRLGDVFKNAGHRPGDVAGRLDSNLFALLFPETDFKYVGKLADSVRARVRKLGIAAAPTESHKTLTVTIGMATVIPNGELTPAELRARVETALYEAQFHGGDRCVRYKALESFRLEQWNPRAEGELTIDGLRHKLAVLGYDTLPKNFQPGEALPTRRLPVESVVAVAAGRLNVMLDGESRVLKAGDALFVPKGLSMSFEVLGLRAVACLQGMRADAVVEAQSA